MSLYCTEVKKNYVRSIRNDVMKRNKSTKLQMVYFYNQKNIVVEITIMEREKKKEDAENLVAVSL